MYFKLYLRKESCPDGTNRYNCALFDEFGNNPDIKIVANARTPSGKPARKIHGYVNNENGKPMIFYKILEICNNCHKKYENQGR